MRTTIPSSGDVVRRRVVRRGVVTWAPALFVLLLAACDETPLGPEEALEPEVQAFVAAMNAHRASVGCGPLAWSEAVGGVAQAHSADMLERGYFAHTNPDGDSPFDRMREAGITYSRAAENIAFGYPTGAAVLQGWLGSAGHRANIENCQLTEHGVGLVGTYWTHLFRTP